VVDSSLAGRTFPPTSPYDVSAERVRAFAGATHTPYDDGDPAPVTFPIVVAFEAMRSLMDDPEVGIELHDVIHGEQRFGYRRPVVTGDVLTATLTVDSLRQIGGADIIGTTSVVNDADGELVCTAKATLVHKASS
jgi:hypothetical protein